MRVNIKSIHKNYDLLSMRERFSIFDAARIRGDKREIEAVYAASPQKSYRVTDFYFFSQVVFMLHKVNLIERWNHQTTAEFFLNAEGDGDKSEKYSDSMMLAAYLYVIETDAWALIGDEFGFDVQSYRERLAKESFAISQLEGWDAALRKVAFSENGAREMIARISPAEASENVKTLQSVAEMYRAVLLEEER